MPGTAIPWEAGAASRMPPRLVASSRPDSCAGVRPAVTTTSDLTPRFPHSRATSTTCVAGTVTTARSGGSGSAATDGTHGMPAMSRACGPTAYSRPAKPASRMLSKTVRPSDPGRRLAPAAATDPGRQQRLQAGHVRAGVPAGHGVEIATGLAEGRDARDRHGHLDHAIAGPCGSAPARSR
jgi:hypothetical protein